jgi:phosphatidylethanolamine-binding protein (PEBP) family uncharacterized protein
MAGSPSLDHQPIPARHAEDHGNRSPVLAWSGVPQEAVELACGTLVGTDRR